MKTPIVQPGDNGQRVVELQRLLRYNRWGHDFLSPKARIDGEYGPLTLHAVREARYQLGYPKDRIRPGEVGWLLPRLLEPLDNGGRRLPLPWRARRKKRLALLRRVLPLRLRRFRVAKRHLGYHEGANNDNIFGRWYGLNGQPWCAMFVSFCDHQAGGTFRYSYCPAISEDVLYSRNGLRRTYNPQRGDGVTFDWEMRHSAAGADHVGLFDRWEDQHSGVFWTIEGNTGPQSGSGPEGVYRRQRYTSEVVVFFTMP